jgi:hypothetical protein
VAPGLHDVLREQAVLPPELLGAVERRAELPAQLRAARGRACGCTTPASPTSPSSAARTNTRSGWPPLSPGLSTNLSYRPSMRPEASSSSSSCSTSTPSRYGDKLRQKIETEESEPLETCGLAKLNFKTVAVKFVSDSAAEKMKENQLYLAVKCHPHVEYVKIGNSEEESQKDKTVFL